jgi:hypothetical protein
MRFKAKPFRHPEYDALRAQSESLAFLWGIGHGFFVLFLAMAVVAPIGVAMMAVLGLLPSLLWWRRYSSQPSDS